MAIKIKRGDWSKIQTSTADLEAGQLIVDTDGTLRVNPRLSTETSSGKTQVKNATPITGIGVDGRKTRMGGILSPKLYKHNISVEAAGELSAKATFYSIFPEPFISGTTVRTQETASAKGSCGVYAPSGAIIGVMLRATGHIDAIEQSAASIVLPGRVEGFRFLTASDGNGLEVLFSAATLTLSDAGSASMKKATTYLRYYTDDQITIADEVEIPMLRSLNDIKIGDCIHFQAAAADDLVAANENLIFRHVSRNHDYGGTKYDVWQAARCFSKTTTIHASSNYCGWNTGNLYKQKLDAAKFLPAWIPAKEVSIKAACGTSHSTSPYIIETVKCKLFPAAVVEMYGDGYSYDVDGEGTQFDYYKDLKITSSVYKGCNFYNPDGKASSSLSSSLASNKTSHSLYESCYPGLRSLYSDGSNLWCFVYSGGSPNGNYVRNSYQAAPCFCL